MSEVVTETYNETALGLDTLAPRDILSALLQGQIMAANIVKKAIPDIEKASRLLSETMNNGGNIIYVAAGSSALMALADGLELHGTFGISNERIKILIAGGQASLSNMKGKIEDDENAAIYDLEKTNISKNDCVICVSASGTTPYVVSALRLANEYGAKTIALANNSDSLILNLASISIYLATPAEVISGSTRLGAATAQKIALNMMSTLMGVHLGHVHDGYMVNVQADNEKLKLRAYNLISKLTGCEQAAAQNYMDKAENNVKIAILLAAGSKDILAAKEILKSNDQKIRPSLSVIKGSI